MFEFVKAIASPPPSIRLDTRLGNSIANSQSGPPDAQHERTFARLLEKHDSWTKRKNCCGVYNCFGHVLASRRTSIYDIDEIPRILSDDGYRQVEDDVRSGDIAIYRHLDDGKIFHAGIVQMREIFVAGSRPEKSSTVPWVLSKLNDVMGEVLHPLKDYPAHFEYAVQIWTDRPAS